MVKKKCLCFLPDAPFAGQIVCVRLEKKGRDLGFSLEGGVGSSLENRPIKVQKIFQGECSFHLKKQTLVQLLKGLSPCFRWSCWTGVSW